MEIKLTNCILIDDDPDDIEFFELALNQLLYSINVRSFNDFESAIETIKKENFHAHFRFSDAILLGLAYEKHIEKLNELKKLTGAPVVIISASDLEFSKRKFKDVKIHSFLQKKDSILGLRDMLHDFFQKTF